MQKLMFTSKSDVATLFLRFLYTLICNSGVTQFIKSNMALRQKMNRTTDDLSKFQVRHRLIVELSEDVRQ